MVHSISLKELRPELPSVINNIDAKLDRYIVTKRGKPVAVLMSPADYESLLETIDILSDKQAVERIKHSKNQIKRGETVSLEDLKKQIEDVQS